MLSCQNKTLKADISNLTSTSVGAILSTFKNTYHCTSVTWKINMGCNLPLPRYRIQAAFGPILHQNDEQLQSKGLICITNNTIFSNDISQIFTVWALHFLPFVCSEQMYIQSIHPKKLPVLSNFIFHRVLNSLGYNRCSIL